MHVMKRMARAILILALVAAGGVRAETAPATERTSLSRSELIYQVLVAEIAVRRGRLDTALEHFRTAALGSDDPRLAERAVGIALYVGNDEALLELAERWQMLAPDDLQARQSLALALLRSERIDDAVDHLEAVREALAPRDEQDGFAAISNLLGRFDDKAVVLQALTALGARHPDSPYGHYYRALAALSAEQPETALDSLEQALAVRTDWRDALLLRAQVRMQQDQADIAVEELAAVVERLPDDTDLRLGYARLLVGAEQLDRAREQFNRLAERNPEDAEALFALGVLATEAEQYAEAEAYFDRVLALGQRVTDSRFELARLAELQDDYALARERYEQIDDEERYITAQIRAATMDAGLEQFELMRERLDRLRAEYPDDAVSLHIAEAEILRGEQRYQAAFDTLSSALELYPGNHDLLYSRALAAEKLDRMDVLERDLRLILAEEPDNGHALNALGYTLADRTDRYDEALELLERAIRLLPDDPAVLDSMGWIKYRLGEHEEALGYLRQAYEQSEEPEIAMHLSEVLWAAGRHEEARTVWEEAWEQAPEDEFLLRLKDRFRP